MKNTIKIKITNVNNISSALLIFITLSDHFEFLTKI